KTNRSLLGFGATCLWPLADNGGPTLTHALLPGSPAINAGDPAAAAGVDGVPMTDQRGAPFTRVYGGRIDIGAFELQPTDYILGDFNRNGTVDSADYVLYRKQQGQTVAPGAGADANGDGNGDESDYSWWRATYGTEQSQLLAAIVQAPAFGSAEDSAVASKEPRVLSQTSPI